MFEPEVAEKTQAELEAEHAQAQADAAAADEKAAASAAAGEKERKTPEEEAAEEKRKGGVQRRINELVRKVAEAEARADYLEKLALAKAAEPAKPIVDAAKPKPQSADFDTTEEFMEALAAHTADEKVRELRAELDQKAKVNSEKSEQETQIQRWKSNEVATQEKHPDYEEVFAAAMESLRQSSSRGCQAVAHAIQVSDAGPELMYYLGEHPAEVQALAKLHPTAAVMALGKIEGRLAGDNGGAVLPASQPRASKPPTPVKRGAPTGTPRPDDPESDKALSDEEWLMARNAQLKSR